MECTYNIYGLEFYSGNEMGADRGLQHLKKCVRILTFLEWVSQ